MVAPLDSPDPASTVETDGAADKAVVVQGGSGNDYMDGQGDSGDVCLGGRGLDSFGGNGCETFDHGLEP